MKIHFDEHTLRDIADHYETFVVMTDYVDQIDVYKGPLNEYCFDMIKFYLNKGWLNDCVWNKRQVFTKHGHTKLITEAVRNGEEVFNITVLVKERVDLSFVGEAPSKHSWFKSFALGFVASFFSLDKLLEIVGGAAILNSVNKRR